MMKRLSVFCAALAFATAAVAQQYKWTDQDGKVRYGDVPPPGVKATRMKPPTGGAAPAPAAAATKDAKKDAKKDEKPLTPEQAFQKRQKEQREADEKAAKDRSTADARRANCDSAQAQLAQLQSGQRVARTDAKGERAFIEDDQRAGEIARAQRGVAEWCK